MSEEEKTEPEKPNEPNGSEGQPPIEAGKSVDTTQLQQLFGSIVREKEGRIAALEAELHEVRTPKRELPTPTDATELLTNPNKFIRPVVEEALKETVKPLLELAQELKSERIYGRVKQAAIQANPSEREFITANEGLIDSIMQGQAPTIENYNTAIIVAYGVLAKQGKLGNQNGKARLPNTPDVSASKPDAPKPDAPAKRVRNLTPDERQAASIFGMSDEAYIEWSSKESNRVDDWPSKPKPGAK